VRDLLIVDGANVVGSVPNGWWRDRAGAAARLRDALEPLASDDVEVVLVVEGAARGVEGTARVRVVSASGSGDDAIVDLVAAGAGRDVTVVTSDRGLRERVADLGGSLRGPRTVPYP
jgi:hypothetical protein